MGGEISASTWPMLAATAWLGRPQPSTSQRKAADNPSSARPCSSWLSRSSVYARCWRSVRWWPKPLSSSPQLDKSACYNSKALEHYRELSNTVVQEYENHVRLCQLSDPDKEDYLAGPYQPSGTVEKPFTNAGHAFYDSKAFKGDEYDVAKALDKHSHVWVRNKDRLDYGIPLPVKSGSSSTWPSRRCWPGSTATVPFMLTQHHCRRRWRSLQASLSHCWSAES